MTLERIETKRGHKYQLDGKPVKGVTTIIGNATPKPALPYWAAKQVASYVVDNPEALSAIMGRGRDEAISHLKQVPWRERDKAAARGTDVHRIAEDLVHGRAADVAPELWPYVNGYLHWLDAWDAEPVVTERPCANRTHWYAGTFDAVLKFNRGPLDGGVFLCDWKTSSGVYGEMAMQLAAYANAEFYLDDNGVETSMPVIDGLAIVHVTPDGTSVHRVVDDATAWQMFLLAQQASEAFELMEKLLSKIGDDL